MPQQETRLHKRDRQTTVRSYIHICCRLNNKRKHHYKMLVSCKEKKLIGSTCCAQKVLNVAQMFLTFRKFHTSSQWNCYCLQWRYNESPLPACLQEYCREFQWSYVIIKIQIISLLLVFTQRNNPECVDRVKMGKMDRQLFGGWACNAFICH